MDSEQVIKAAFWLTALGVVSYASYTAIVYVRNNLHETITTPSIPQTT